MARFEEMEHALRSVVDERNQLRQTRAQLEEIRSSETYRAGRMVVAPLMIAKRWAIRVSRAWHRSGG